MGSMTRRSLRDDANQEAYRRLAGARPVLRDIRPAIEVVPRMTRDLVLTSGPLLRWSDYEGGQRRALIGGALFEGLAADAAEAEAKLASGAIRIGACQDHDCIGSVAGIYTASMPVFVIENEAFGNRAFSNMYEGQARKRLNYGSYDDEVKERLDYINAAVAPVLGEAVRASGGIELAPIIKRALHMGDELHSRNTAASLLFAVALFPALLDLPPALRNEVKRVTALLVEDNYFFLRLSMGAAKASAAAIAGIPHASVLSTMGLNCRSFGIQVAGLDGWIEGPLPDPEAKLFEGHGKDEIAWLGGESIVTETVGLGGLAQAAAFPLFSYQGGEPLDMIARTEQMYAITIGEHPDYRIPVLKYRGTPTAIDIFRVVESGITPFLDIGIAGKGGMQIGAGVVQAPLPCFEAAVARYNDHYG
ncbi:YahG/YlbE-like protein [Rhizorhabdus wittichii DC-6]|nr:YahG/YlbE-like protein [Rhizorhabdus wittichii DC-6]